MRKSIILKIKKTIFSFIAVLLAAGAVTVSASAEDSTIKIGVLAKRGPERCMEKWSPTAEYLNSMIPGKTFKIVPIDFDQIYSVVEKAEVDFILTNPSFYVELENWHKVNRIATLKNTVLDGIHTKYGGVVFCKKQRNDIRQYSDLKGKAFMAVKDTSFGGWRMVWLELKQAGIDPFKDFASLSFGRIQDEVVYAVQNGKVDVGSVRTDTLERMNAEGKIHIDDFYVIHEHGGGKVHLPFLHSTREYPEWAFAKLKHTSNELAENVSIALIDMPRDSAAAQAAKCAGWTIPLNYQSVHDCLKELKVGPYKNLGKITLTDIFKKYWVLILIDLATLIVLSCFLLTRIRLNRKINAAHKELSSEVKERIQTERLLQKEKNRVLAYLDIVGVIIVVLNRDQSIAVINKKGCEILGYDESELLGKKWIDNFLPEKAREGARAIFSKQMAGDVEPIKYYENHILTKDNKKRHILWNNSVLRDDKGKIIATLASGEDITESRNIETQLRHAQKMESVGRLAGGVAHDYNNMLSVIMGYTELAKMEVDPTGKLHADLDEILKAAKRATNITRQLLAFARKQTIAPEVLDLNKNVENMLKMLRHLIGEDIDLVWLPGASLWSVKMDPSQMDQILANLCVNAQDAIQGVGKVTIETKRVTFDEVYCADHVGFVPGKFVLLAVSDNGCGMDKEILDNIFEPFFTTKDVDKGTGLGLATIYGIVKQNNGFINAYSEPGKGTTIKIYLPGNKGEAVDIPEENTNEIQKGQGETVLLVEDDLSILELTKKNLDNLGYNVLTAGTPGKAMDLAREHSSKIHLLVTDVIMPEMNGLELANSLKSFCPGLKCMFMSGYTANAIAHHGVLDKGVLFIQKPFSRKDLAKIVRKALDE